MASYLNSLGQTVAHHIGYSLGTATEDAAAQEAPGYELSSMPPAYTAIEETGGAARPIAPLPSLARRATQVSLASVPPLRPIELTADNVPTYFLCPITKAPFEDPVLALDGFTYSRDAIEAHFAAEKAAAQNAGRPYAPTSPVTGKALPTIANVPPDRLIGNLPIKTALEEFALDPTGETWKANALDPVTLEPHQEPGALCTIDPRHAPVAFTAPGSASPVRDHGGEMFDLTDIYEVIRSSLRSHRNGREPPQSPSNRSPFGEDELFVPNHVLKRLAEGKDDALVQTEARMLHLYYRDRDGIYKCGERPALPLRRASTPHNLAAVLASVEAPSAARPAHRPPPTHRPRFGATRPDAARSARDRVVREQPAAAEPMVYRREEGGCSALGLGVAVTTYCGASAGIGVGIMHYGLHTLSVGGAVGCGIGSGVVICCLASARAADGGF